MTGRPLCLAACLALLLSGCGGSTSEAGPLVLTRGQMTNMLQPLPERAFFAIPACLEGEPDDVELLTIRAERVSGASKSDVEFLAAWPDKTPLTIAADRYSRLEPAFVTYAKSHGPVRRCGDPSPVTGLEVATVIPQAVDRAVIVDGLEIDYRVGGTKYRARVDVTLGMCAPEPASPDKEPTECRR